MSSTQWPPVLTTTVFKLAMIQKERIQRGRIDDELIRLSITGKVDDILQRKTPINIENIFTNCGDKRLVLIEGAPGSGKSTLALHICQEWAKGKLFQEYDVVVLVRLRDPLIREAKTVADLLPCADEAMAKKAETAMKAQFGRGVLWVLDGWDELPSDLLIIKKLIQPDMFRESPLHQSAVIVTSRPSSSAELHLLVSSRVEILGFTPHELEQYFRGCIKGDSGAVQTLRERIQENPAVEGSCYLPLNAAIVAHVFISGDYSLPTSNHGIFMEVVKSFLKRYLQDRQGITAFIGNITSPDSLPPEIQKPVGHLCQLAFHGITSNKITFSESDLTALSIPKDISIYGLLQSVPSIVSDGHQTYFCFLHLSIQELLAAVHISHMSSKQQISVFQELFGTPRFSAVFQFYAGITKLKVSRPFLSKLPRFLCRVPTSVYDLVTKVVEEEEKKSFRLLVKPKPLLVSLVRCLYEAEDSTLCVFVADLLHHSLSLSTTTLTPLDCLSIGSFLSAISTTVSGAFTVHLKDCSISDQGCKFLARGFSRHLNTHSEITLQFDVDLSTNDINDIGAHHIAELLKNIRVVQLNLSRNRIGEDGLKSLCKVLSTSTSLKELKLADCSLILNEENGSSLYQLLNGNESLTCLNLSVNVITDCSHIGAGLSNNQTLRTLILRHCSLTDKRIQELSGGLNNYIEELNIGDNDSITENRLAILARHLTTLSRMRRLIIPNKYHWKSYINTAFSELDEERRKKELPEIRVKGECDSISISL